MTTRELIEGLPQNIRNKVEYFREQRTSLRQSYDHAVERRDATEELFYYNRYIKHIDKWSGYCSALRDAGIVNEQGRKMLYIYGTILCGSNESRAVHEESA